MKKFLKVLSVILLTGIIFSACQKEYDIIDGIATGTLKEDASGDCMPVVINGIYTTNVNVGAANFVDLQVNIDNIGTYDISTDTVNGYFFHAAGSVAITGLNTIRLQASGKPIITGTDIFKVKFSGTVCELNVSVTTGGPGGGNTAVFTLRAATTGAACTGAVQSGAYNQGLATSSSNTATVFADVTAAGTYTAGTTTVNGVSFSGSGTLAVGTNQPIVLTANGIPAGQGTFNYPVTVGSASCSFDIVYGAALSPAVLTPNCTGATVNGTYQAGTAMTSSNTIIVPVTVTTAGTYTANAASQNGVSFSGSGVVSLSTTFITLTASATTPTAQGTFTYSIILNGTPVCSVPVTVTAGTSTSGLITCKIDGTFTSFPLDANGNQSSGTFNQLNLGGTINPGDDPSISFSLQSIPAFANGTTYTVNQFASGVILTARYTDAAHTNYDAGTDGTIQTNPFTFTITTITATRAIGTFSGPLVGGAITKAITEGTFDVPL